MSKGDIDWLHMATFLFFMVAVLFIAYVIKLAGSHSDSHSRPKLAEKKVSSALRQLNMKSYILFENIILPSNGSTKHTEIDHVVVSPYGIFCIETKSHGGSIYAHQKSKEWIQYIGGKKFTFNSPYRQNYKHIKALEMLLGSNVKAPIHSYVIFPYAYKVVTDSKYVYEDPYRLAEQISKHRQRIYDIHEFERISKSLALAADQKDELLEVHVQEVKDYLERSI